MKDEGLTREKTTSRRHIRKDNGERCIVNFLRVNSVAPMSILKEAKRH